MDEVAEIIKTLAISSHDLADIMTNYTTIIDGHLLKWTVPDYNGEFNEYKRLCDLDCVGIYDDIALVWLFPVATFRAFQSIYVLTYLFEAQTQKYYYDFYGLTYTYFHVSGNSLATYNFTPGKADNRALIAQYRTLATICETTKLNLIGEHPTALSATWYDNNYKKPPFTVLKNNLTNFFKKQSQGPVQPNALDMLQRRRKRPLQKRPSQAKVTPRATPPPTPVPPTPTVTAPPSPTRSTATSTPTSRTSSPRMASPSMKTPSPCLKCSSSCGGAPSATVNQSPSTFPALA